MPVHYGAWADTVRKYGGQIPEELFYRLGGWPSRKMVELLNERFGTSLDPETIANEKEHLYVQRIDTIRPIPGSRQFRAPSRRFCEGVGGLRRNSARRHQDTGSDRF